MKREMLFHEYAKQLEGEYKEAYQKMSFYMQAHIAIGDDYSLPMNDVVDLLLSAQQDQKPIQNVIGSNMEELCDQLIASNSKHMLGRFLNFIAVYRVFALILFILECFALFVDYVDGVKNPWLMRLEVGDFVSILIISTSFTLIFSFLVKYISTRYKWYTKNINNLCTILVFGSLLATVFLIPDDLFLSIYVPRWIFLPFLLFFYVGLTIHKKTNKRKEIASGSHISFQDTVINENIEQYRKKYKKYVKRNDNKGKAIMDVSTWYEKKYEMDRRIDSITTIFFIVILISFSLLTYSNSTFFDTMIFICVLLIVEVPLFLFFDKGRKSRNAVHDMIEKKNTDIFDDSLKLDI